MTLPYVIAIIPAHNEAKNIAATLHSIRNQVNQIVVACDNCDDQTFEVAINNGADHVFKTVNNHGRKAGALNQALKQYVDWSIPNLYLMIIDADTQITPNWMAKAASLIKLHDPHPHYYLPHPEQKYDAVGSIFYSANHRHPSILERCQYNEWVRYANKIHRDRKVFVLTGTCSLISAQKLLAVYHKFGHFYDEQSITEDFAMTVDLKSVGARMISPLSCRCTTETMNTYGALIRQRRRWYLGAIQLVLHRKWNRVVLRYAAQQALLMFSVFAFFLFILASVIIYMTGDIDITLFWTVTFLIFDLERVATIHQTSTQDKWFAASMLPELWYALILDVAYILAWLAIICHSHLYWNQTNHPKKNERSKS